MNNQNINPWAGMPPATWRRLSGSDAYSLFWMTDERGRYGLYLKGSGVFDSSDFDMSLKGIAIQKKDSTGELFLILNRQEDWELFLAICTDLAAILEKANAAWVSAVHRRLVKWQQFLKQNRNWQLSIEKQMGLFSELSYLADYLLPVLGIKRSLDAWVGPDFDKQDFSLNNISVEVKSYISSRGPVIQISSVHQLDIDTKPLELAAYGLTVSDAGLSVADAINRILEAIRAEDESLEDIFNYKLAQYGYISEFAFGPYQRFVIDRVMIYGVSDAFPKLKGKDLSNEIVAVKYSIDLSKCVRFEIAELLTSLK